MTTQKPTWIPLLVLLAVAVLALFTTSVPGAMPTEGLDTGDTAWMIVASGLVLLMTPGLAYFYGGMVNHKNVISTMLQSFIAMGVISVIWIVFGFSLAFGDSLGGWIGDPRTFFMFNGVFDHKLSLGSSDQLKFTIPFALFAFFQMKFAVITPALISGALAERINFRAFVLFMVLFCVVVYAPLAHWTWHPDGFLFNLGVLDFAGGTVVHMSAGWAALAGALYLRRRKSHIESNILPPANIPYVLLGTGLLWFGWFGFNAGSALSAGHLAATAMINTQIATAAASMTWMAYEKYRDGKATTLGVASGAVAGAVAITPACGYLNPLGALILGLIAGVVSAWAVTRKYKYGYDDSLDVVGVHGVGGILGMLSIGFLATLTANSAGANGLFFHGGTSQIDRQLIAVIVVAAFSFAATWLIATLISKTIGFRVFRDDELNGLDTTFHAESAYDITGNSNRY